MHPASSSVPRKPWEVDGVLKPRRLQLLSQVAMETRNRAFSEANRDEGDTNWGLGCKAHERFCHALQQLAEGSESPWLRVQREGLSFTTFIEHLPVRVYRGSVLRPPMRHVRTMAAERSDARQLSLFGDAAPVDTWFWMMAVETFDDGQVKRTVFFQVDETGATQNQWEPPAEPLFGDDEPKPVVKRRKRAAEITLQ